MCYYDQMSFINNKRISIMKIRSTLHFQLPCLIFTLLSLVSPPPPQTLINCYHEPPNLRHLRIPPPIFSSNPHRHRCCYLRSTDSWFSFSQVSPCLLNYLSCHHQAQNFQAFIQQHICRLE